MEFGNEYNQFLQKELQKKYPNKFLELWYTKKNFKWYAVGGGALLVLLIALIIFMVIQFNKPPVENKIFTVKHNNKALDYETYREEYYDLVEETDENKTKIADIVIEYYNIAHSDDAGLSNSTRELIKELGNYCSPARSVDLNSILLDGDGKIRRSLDRTLLDDAGNQYRNFKYYVYDRFIKLPMVEEVFNDIETCENNILNTYYKDRERKGVHTTPIRTLRMVPNSNFLTYYSDYNHITGDNQEAILNELSLYEKLVKMYLENIDKVTNSDLKEFRYDGKRQNVESYLRNNFVKFVNLTPLIYNDRLSDVEIIIDFVPSKYEVDYYSTVRDSASWSDMNIASIVVNVDDLWQGILGGSDFGFYPNRVDIFSYSLKDYTGIVRDIPLTKEGYVVPTFNINVAGNLDVTYKFSNSELIINSVVNENTENRHQTVAETAKEIYEAYYSKAQDRYSKELLQAGSLSYTWEYVYNDFNVVPYSNLNVAGFASGVRVIVIALDKNGQQVDSYVIKDSEVNIERNSVTVN